MQGRELTGSDCFQFSFSYNYVPVLVLNEGDNVSDFRSKPPSDFLRECHPEPGLHTAVSDESFHKTVPEWLFGK